MSVPSDANRSVIDALAATVTDEFTTLRDAVEAVGDAP
jgi:hypothetical protein